MNLLVDLFYNFFITWSKRQEDLEYKLEKFHKEYNQLADQYSLINKNINLVLQILEENKVQQYKGVQNSDYIKEEVALIHKKLESSSTRKEIIKPLEDLKELDQENLKIKNLLEEIKTLVLS